MLSQPCLRNPRMKTKRDWQHKRDLHQLKKVLTTQSKQDVTVWLGPAHEESLLLNQTSFNVSDEYTWASFADP
ncbi:hypothetical protein VTN77DRAFT_1104 [Rasamsonia byssochlamydoides]|uniref:uncharacterized protein n=1 Tax=Rasamsonia byssochlamydoides TaxID=89139 RepID=UPI003743F789